MTGQSDKQGAGLTARQRVFVDEYLVGLNTTAAAIRAGYSAKNAGKIGPELLGKTRISAAIHERMKAREERVNITQDYVLGNLTEIVERCMQRRPVLNMGGKQVQDEDGNNLWAFDAKGANRALELLGKHLGMFKDKVEMDVSLTPASILAAARKNQEKIEAQEQKEARKGA